LVEFGGEVESAAGEVERVCGGLTATESAREVVVERDVCELVRRREAASRGRVEAMEMDGGGVLAPMRAASWLREGRRPLEEGGRSAFESSGPGCEAVDGFVLMAGGFVSWWRQLARGGGVENRNMSVIVILLFCPKRVMPTISPSKDRFINSAYHTLEGVTR
jgi:hypothetical protein